MSFGIGAGGFVGVAFETTAGVYAAPTKFFPIRSESLRFDQDNIKRKPIRGVADIISIVPGNSKISGDVVVEGLEDALVYFLHAARCTVVKSGGSPNFVYTYSPSSAATPPNKTLSITVVRDGIVFGYVGCSVGTYRIHIDQGLLIGTFTIMGMDEAVQSLPTATFNQNVPFGPGQYNIQVPTSTQVFDADTFEFHCDDMISPEYRLQNVGRRAQFLRYGERTVKLTMERDFQTRADFDLWKAVTAGGVTIQATKSVNNSFSATITQAVRADYTVHLTGQGELLRAHNEWEATYDPAVSQAYSLVVATQENI